MPHYCHKEIQIGLRAYTYCRRYEFHASPCSPERDDVVPNSTHERTQDLTAPDSQSGALPAEEDSNHEE